MTDTGTVIASITASLAGGGIIGGIVSLLVAGRESQDRRTVLDFQREQWVETASREHAQWLRVERFKAYTTLIDAVTDYAGEFRRGERQMAMLRAATRAQAVSSQDVDKTIASFMRMVHHQTDEGRQHPSDPKDFGVRFDALRTVLNRELTAQGTEVAEL